MPRFHGLIFSFSGAFFESVPKVCPNGKKKKAYIAVSLDFVGVRMVGATRLERATSTTPRYDSVNYCF